MRTTIFLFSVALLLFCVSPALAAGPAADAKATQDARTRFHRGVQLYNEGSFEAALAEFNKAYQISPNYRLLYNIAQTQFDLHDYVAASRNLGQYMREGAGEIPEDRRAQVSDLVRKLEERIGHVEVSCNLDGAEIRIDDIPVGTSPLRVAVPVNAGPRRITAIKTGHPTAVRLITVSGMETTKVALELAARRGSGLVDGEGATGDPDSDADLVQHKAPGKKRPSSRAGLITSSVVAGGCAIATGVLGILALQAKSDFDRDLKAIPGSQYQIDNDRSKMKSYALATDVLAGATLLSAGAVLYFLLTDSTESGAPRTSLPKRSVALTPTVGGLVLHGGW
jgi:tetratricopeptide (TPR) repeat protein